VSATFEEIIVDSVQLALGLPRDPIAVDVRDLALAVMNKQGRIIWDAWPWDDEKVDEFEAPAMDASGIVTFAATVDVVRAVRAIQSGSTDDSGTRIWNQDELVAAARGEAVESDRFITLAQSGGCRRIQLADPDSDATYKVLALKRWVPAVVDDAYSAGDPTATPTDYRVLEYVPDRAEPAVREYVEDALREWDGQKARNQGDALLRQAWKRENEQGDRERRAEPRYPAFDEAGNWW